MSKKNDAWGIEVGADAIKAIRLVRGPEGVRVADYDILPFKRVLTTPDLNVDEAIQVNLDAFVTKHDLSKSNVVVSVPGHMAFARFAKLPPVDPKKIPDIVKFEAVQQIPFPIEQVEWDYQVFQQEDSPDVEVGIFAITKERVITYLNNFRRVNVNVDGLTLSPLAVFNAFAYDLQITDSDEGVILLDIGASSTDVIIVENGRLWLRTLPIGGNHFTEVLVRSFKLSFPKAEKLKREAATSKYARQIFQAMRPVFADLVQELQRSLGYYQSLNRDANLTKIIGVGSTFRLPGLQKFLKQQLQMEVTRPDGYKRIKVEGKQEADFVDNALNLATAYGLALQGLGEEKVSANILPRHILTQRMWKAKQPWIAAAAIVMLASVVGAEGRRVYDAQAFASAWEGGSQSAKQQVEQVLHRARQLRQEWDQVQSSSDPRQQIGNLRRILDYRDIWPKLIEDLTLAAMSLNPQPELLVANYEASKNIPPGQRRRVYIETVAAAYAGGQGVSESSGMGGHHGPGGPGGMGPGGPGGFEPGGPGGFGPGGPGGLPGGGIMQTPTGPLSGKVDESRPRFIITITGTTPNADAIFLVPQQFVGWFKSNAKRSDRPYEIMGDSFSVSLSEVPVESTPAASGGGGAPAAPAAADFPGRRPAIGSRTPGNPGNPGNLGGSAGPGGPGGYGASAGGNQASDNVNVTDLLPKRPQPAQAAPTQYRFEIRWRVTLATPEEARASEELTHKAAAQETAAEPKIQITPPPGVTEPAMGPAPVAPAPEAPAPVTTPAPAPSAAPEAKP
jgi:type IV pilus assembly protein PilM